MSDSSSAATRFVTSYDNPADIPVAGLPQVALIGRSNAGKSSLINALTGMKKLAFVSATPGRTQLVNVFEVDGAFRLVDLPGYGFAKGSHAKRDALEDLLIAYLRAVPQLRFAVILLDSRLGPTASDRDMIGQFQTAGVPFALVANKVDKLSRAQMLRSVAAIQQAYPNVPVIAHSAVTGVGKQELLGLLKEKTRAR